MMLHFIVGSHHRWTSSSSLSSFIAKMTWNDNTHTARYRISLRKYIKYN